MVKSLRSSVGQSWWVYSACLGSFVVTIALTIAGIAETWTILFAKMSVAGFFLAQGYDHRVRKPRRSQRHSHDERRAKREFIEWVLTAALIGLSVALLLFSIRGFA